MLKNAFLSFLALIDFPFEFRCLMLGKYPQIVTADACVKLATNFVSKAQTVSSRPAKAIDTDSLMYSLKLSLVSPALFGGVNVLFVMGALEADGSSPVWTAPGNRLSETFLRSQRGSLQGESRRFTDGECAKLTEALAEKGGGIGAVDSMQMEELKELHKKVLASRISK